MTLWGDDHQFYEERHWAVSLLLSILFIPVSLIWAIVGSFLYMIISIFDPESV